MFRNNPFLPPDIEPIDPVPPDHAPLIRRAVTASVLALALGFGLGFFAGRARAETIEGPAIRVIDGDTVNLPGGERIRIYNIDAPETHEPHCEAERERGHAATQRLALLLAEGPVSVQRCEADTGRCKDRYGRTLARLIAPHGDVGMLLIQDGLAEPWAPGRAAKEARIEIWCGR